MRFVVKSNGIGHATPRAMADAPPYEPELTAAVTN